MAECGLKYVMFSQAKKRKELFAPSVCSEWLGEIGPYIGAKDYPQKKHTNEESQKNPKNIKNTRARVRLVRNLFPNPFTKYDHAEPL
jgi:hypothetical protein